MKFVYPLEWFVVCFLSFLLDKVWGQSGSPAPLSQNQVSGILTVWNNIRRNVIPPASTMNELVWSNTLARAAESYSQNCRFESNTNWSHLPFESVQELSSVTGSSFLDFNAVIEQSWLLDGNFYNITTNTCSRSFCHFYTRLVTANTTSIGCGASYCPNNPPTTPGSNYLIYVCLISPIYNAAVRPYEEGISCSDCSNICENKLCITHLTSDTEAENVPDPSTHIVNVVPSTTMVSVGNDMTTVNDAGTTNNGETSKPFNGHYFITAVTSLVIYLVFL